MAIIYGLKVNLSVAIVAMVNHTAIAANDNITGDTDGDKIQDGPLVWSTTEQGAVLGSYFLGYFITQVKGCNLMSSALFALSRFLVGDLLKCTVPKLFSLWQF